MQIIFLIRRFIAMFLASFIIMGVPAVSETHDVKDPENCKMNFSVVTDAHIEGVSVDNERTRPARQLFVKAMRDIKNCKTENDAVVFLGDNTMNGQDIENLFFYGMIENIQPAKNIYTAMGNHDTGNGINDYEKRAKRFWSYYNGFTNSNVQKPYYYYEMLDNCCFIFMASESDAVNAADISMEQIQWLDGVLTEAENAGVPAFVFNHHTPWHIQANSSELIDVLTKHHDVFYMSGHTHTTQLTAYDFDEDTHYFNIPKMTDKGVTDDGTKNDSGLGLQVEIYDSEVTIRGRHFCTSEWSDYDFTYNIK